MYIDDLYDLIPELMCTEGCYECCKNFGVPSRTKVEDERIKTFFREHSMQAGEPRATPALTLMKAFQKVAAQSTLSGRSYAVSTAHLPTIRARWESSR